MRPGQGETQDARRCEETEAKLTGPAKTWPGLLHMHIHKHSAPVQAHHSLWIALPTFSIFGFHGFLWEGGSGFKGTPTPSLTPAPTPGHFLMSFRARQWLSCGWNVGRRHVLARVRTSQICVQQVRSTDLPGMYGKYSNSEVGVQATLLPQGHTATK